MDTTEDDLLVAVRRSGRRRGGLAATQKYNELECDPIAYPIAHILRPIGSQRPISSNEVSHLWKVRFKVVACLRCPRRNRCGRFCHFLKDPDWTRRASETL